MSSISKLLIAAALGPSSLETARFIGRLASAATNIGARVKVCIAPFGPALFDHDSHGAKLASVIEEAADTELIEVGTGSLQKLADEITTALRDNGAHILIMER